ncbi:uncharacterized protein LOC124356116 [Homalodisca vitripennis]|uniref:uncharacterized protein LOC124356116 n=1 Tax=Homalodisca vitripennis TaxID=197043 RepID=UPI001EE9E619|nr:uncharacterized protein LOC124356116 [Homalodisca vitripennis]
MLQYELNIIALTDFTIITDHDGCLAYQCISCSETFYYKNSFLSHKTFNCMGDRTSFFANLSLKRRPTRPRKNREAARKRKQAVPVDIPVLARFQCLQCTRVYTHLRSLKVHQRKRRHRGVINLDQNLVQSSSLVLDS